MGLESLGPYYRAGVGVVALDAGLVRGLTDSLELCLSSGPQAADLPGRTWRNLAESPKLGKGWDCRGQENRRALP